MRAKDLDKDYDPEAAIIQAQEEKDPKVRAGKLYSILAGPPYCKTFSKYAKSFLKITDKEAVMRWFELNRPQRRIMAKLIRQQRAGRPRRIVVPKARQEGVSTFAEGLIFGEASTIPNTTGMVMAHKLDSSIHLFGMTKRFYDNLDFRPPTKYSTRKEIVFAPPLNSRILIESAEDRDAGRGQTPQLVHCSEVAFWPDARETMSGFLPGVPKTKRSLVILESTGNGVGGWFYDTAVRASQGQSQFELCFLPWHAMTEYRMPVSPRVTWRSMDLSPEEQILKDEHHLSMEQIQWRRWMIMEMNGDMVKFSQEYPATLDECFQSHGSPVFRHKPIQDMMKAAVQDPPMFVGSMVYEGGRPILKDDTRGNLKLWEMPRANARYVMGVDCGMGYASSDLSTISVLDAATGAQVAAYAGRVDPNEFGKLCVWMGWTFNTAFMAIEANNHGVFVLDVVRSIGYYNLLNRKTYEPTVHQFVEKAGWATTVKTKPPLIDYAAQMLHGDPPVLVRDTDLLREMSRFQYDENGDPCVPKGEQDDRLFAWMIALQAYKFQANSSGHIERRPEYTGPDAWVWRNLDSRIRAADAMKRRTQTSHALGLGRKW